LNWDAFLRRARQWGWERGVYLACRLASELVGAAVPPEVLLHLKPGELSEHVVEVARTRVLVEKEGEVPMSPNLVQMWKHRSLWGKARLVLKRVFLPRTDLAAHHGIRVDSWKLNLLYALRPGALMLRHARLVWGLTSGNREITSRNDRQYLISQWLSKA
jgi:hypothetical protein